jgi:hypothetical protein
MPDSDILEEEPGPAPALYRASMERTSGRRGEEITNADQISLLNSSIEIAVKRQSDNCMQYLDSRISKISKPTTTNSDDLTFKGEGNKVQFKFNSERSSKLSEILECLQSRNYDSVEDVIKSEISQIGQRNKIIKIADRHGWDVVKEYAIHPLVDDNDDAVKPRATINIANRRRPKPYDRSVQPNFANQGRGSLFRRQYQQTMSKTGPQQSAFQPGSCFECHLPGHFARQCPYNNRRQFIPRKPPSATITAPGVDVSQSTQ